MRHGVQCRYCGSPAVKNPCWAWRLPGYRPGGGDPLCDLDPEYDDQPAKRPCGFTGHEAVKAFVTFLILAVPVMFFVLVFTLGR